MRSEFYSISEVADVLTTQLGQTIRPQQISNLLYHRELDEKLCPRIGNRHVVDRSYLPGLIRVLQRKGWVRQSAELA